MGAPRGSKPSVVVVDDSGDVRALVRRRLQASGLFEVVGEGADGDQAIGLAYRHEPALVLLDTSMPRMDGIEALPAILALCPDTKVVMFTGFEGWGLADLAHDLGASDFIEKSIPLEQLPERLMLTLADAPARSSTNPPRRLSVVNSGSEQEAAAHEQAVLNEHVAQFRDLFDQAEIGMAILTLNGTIVRANRALARLMGCRTQDLVGVDYGQLTAGAGEKLDRALEALGSTQELSTIEHHLLLRPRQKTPRIVRATLAPIRDSKGQILYVFTQVQDISAQRAAEGDLRRSEEHFRLLVRAVGEYAIFMLDVEGNVISWNSGAQRIKGYTANEIVGQTFRVFYPPEEQATGHPDHNLEVALEEGTFAEEGWRLRKDGTRFWASVVISPVYDDDGTHIGFAKVTRDQSAMRDYEEERQRAVSQHAHLLDVTAHELRTPTAVIDGSAGTLRESWDTLPDIDRDELLTGIRRSAHRLRRLASDLATASRVQAKTLRLRLDNVSLADTVRGAAARRSAAGTYVQIDVNVRDEAVLHADAERLSQALDNLLDNAVRHGSPPITLIGAADGDGVHIRVADAGAGVPSELVPQLFQKFAIAGATGGTGLGLYLVSEIAREHGGRATYHPPGPGQQAAFEISLPHHP